MNKNEHHLYGQQVQVSIDEVSIENYLINLGAIDALRILYKAGADPLHVDKDSLSGKSQTILIIFLLI